LSVCPDEITPSIAEALAPSPTVVFDLPGLEPVDFGWGTEWKGSTGLMAHPTEVDRIAADLEGYAQAAYT
jgi:hypothetical protein